MTTPLLDALPPPLHSLCSDGCGRASETRCQRCPACYERARKAKQGPCSVDGCTRTAATRGWCGPHYDRWRVAGDPLAPKQKSGRKPHEGPCIDCNERPPSAWGGSRCLRCLGRRRRAAEREDPEVYERVKQRARDHANAAHARLRAEVVAAYGSACACCAESQVVFLALDHINGGGNAHRRSIGSGSGSATSLYRDVKGRGFPRDEFQLLCHNCNFAKSHGGCPHVSA